MGPWGLENLNPMIFVQRTPLSIDLSKKINFSTKIAQDYIWTHTILQIIYTPEKEFGNTHFYQICFRVDSYNRKAMNKTRKNYFNLMEYGIT